jgi:ABC-type dipeptide/oligopeptide/nickel transport system permease component
MKNILISLAISFVIGIILGLIGFLWGTSVPDEKAGEAGILFGTFSFIVGTLISFIVIYFMFF